MQRKEASWPIFVFFLLLSLLIFLFSKTSLLTGIGIVGNALFPVQAFFYRIATFPSSWHEDTQLVRLQNENLTLKTQLVHDQELQNEDIALRDQFQISLPVSQSLLPATIIGMQGYVPGIAFPEAIILDKGSSNGIHIKDAVVYKNSVVGQIVAVNSHAAAVTLLTNSSASFTANTLTTNAAGILKGQGNGQMILDNVLLSDTLRNGDTVVTKGDQSFGHGGFPPGLIIGKISSIEKNPTSLFQSAKIQSLLDITKLHIVFVVKE